MRKLECTHDAVKFMNSLDAKQYKQVGRKVFSLLADPRPNDSKQMTGEKGRFRADVGEYRIIYRFTDIEVTIIAIGKRNDDEVYK